MRNQKVKQAFLKCLLNYRIVFAYFMATTFFFMHYFVTSTEFERPESDAGVNSRLINRFRSKKLLNFDTKPRKMGKFSLEKIFSSRILVNKLVIDPPAESEYNLKNTTTQFYSQILQDRILVSLMNEAGLNPRGRLFVEAGAYDGETWSNTLHLERNYNWTGLLIEPSPENYKLLRSKNRRAYSINSCLCGGKSSLKSSFIEAGPFGAVSESSTTVNSNQRVTCHPLSRILDEFFRSRGSSDRVVDYLSLDIEGNERSIVESFAWNRYRFNFVNIEFNQSKEVYEWLKRFLTKQGYVETVKDDVWFQDLYMAHASVVKPSRVLKVSEFLNNNGI